MHCFGIIDSKRIIVSFLLLLFIQQSSLKKTKRSKHDPVMHVTRRHSDVTSGSTTAVPTVIDVVEELTMSMGMELDVDMPEVGTQMEACPGRCLSCDLINGCTKCKHRMFLHLKQVSPGRQMGFCIHTCPEGYYGSRGRENLCKKCQVSNCASCFTSNYCTTCMEGYYLHDAQCVKECPAGMGPDDQKKRCVEKVDCEVGSWSSWGECARRSPKKSCKYGKKKRTRVILKAPTENGKQCPKLKETKRCRTPANRCPLINKWYQKQLRRKNRRGRKKGRKGKRRQITNNDTQRT